MKQASTQPRKAIKKAIKVMVVLFVILLLIPIILAGLMLLNPIQNRVVDWTAEYIGTEIGHEISIGSIYLEPFSGFVVNEVLLRDFTGDTMIYATVVDLEISGFALAQNAFVINDLILNEGYFNLKVYANDSITNLTHFINELPKSSDTTEMGLVLVSAEDVSIRNSRFAYTNENEEQTEENRIDFSHLLISNFNADFSDLDIIGDSVAVCIDSLNLREKSGFLIRNMATEASVCNGNVHCENLTLQTNDGIVYGNYQMRGESWFDYQSFIEKVRLDADLYQSNIQFNDIAYFTPNLRDILTPLLFTGRVSGTIDNLKADVEELKFVETGYLVGRVKVKGLPDIANTFIDAELEQLFATFHDASRINIPKDGELIRMSFPDNVQHLGYVDFIGSFTGFVNDFVTRGEIETALGTMMADVNVKTDGVFRYSGNISTKQFQLGQLIDAKPFVKSIAMDLKVDGTGLDLKTMKVIANGRVAHIDVFDYDYRDIKVDGEFTNLVFNGDIAIADTNIKLDFNGMMDFRGEIPRLLAHADIQHLSLARLNLLKSDTFGVYKGVIDIDLKGDERSQLNGRLALTEASYKSKGSEIELKQLVINDRIIKTGHDIEIESDYFNAKVIGRTSLLEAPYAFLHVGHRYLPTFIPQVDVSNLDTLQDFLFEFDIENNDALISLISSDLKLDNSLHVNGGLKMKGNDFNLKTDTLSWSFGNTKFLGNTIEVYPANRDLVAKTHIQKLQLTEQYSIEGINGVADIRYDSVLLNADWAGTSDLTDKGQVSVMLYRTDLMPWNLDLNKLNVDILGSEWRSVKKAKFSADSLQINVNHLELVSEDGLISGDGVLSKKKPTRLDLNVQNFDLSYLSGFSVVQQSLNGVLNGHIDVGYVKERLVVDGDIIIDSLFLDEQEIGNVNGEATYNSQMNVVDVNINIAYRGNETVRLIGDYFPERKKDQLDLEAAFSGFNLTTFEPFLETVLDEIGGTVDGSLSIVGTIDKPDISGGLKINDFEARVPYLNTSYRLNEGFVKVYPDLIAMDRAIVTDQNGAEAVATAQVFHDYFKNLSYDVFLETENFQCLNTSVAENESYYGQAFITGDVNISGYAAHTFIEVDAGTDKGTKLSIPLDGGGDVSEFDFINFVDSAKTAADFNSKALNSELTGLEMDFKLAVDEDAQIQIIFDEKVGDVIKVKGVGDMLMRIDNKGKFNMYGDYVISNGEYLFTLQNVINKRFIVASGSKLTWNGEVDEARLDLTATYKLKASPAVMVEAMTSTAEGGVDDVYLQRLPVNVNLMMLGPIATPEITFDVGLPTLPESDIANQLLAPGLASKEQITSQAFSLLIANHFSSGNGNVALGGAGQSSGFEVLSNQVSNWASQYSDKFDVGVNYDTYTNESGQSGSETELSFSTNLFDDRVKVEVNGSVQGNSDAQSEEQTNNLAGEFNVEYKVNRDGSLRARVYNESNSQSAAKLNQSPYTQGVGLQYRKEFDTWGQFFRQLFTSKEEREKRRASRKAEKTSRK